MFDLGSIFPIFSHKEPEEYIDYSAKLLGAPAHWVETKGDGIGVAILDTGIDLEHPDLKANIKLALDFTGSKHGPQDVQGHGTHVAGIIGADDQKKGIVGIAPNCNIFSLKVLADNGNGTMDMLVNGLNWVIAHHRQFGIKIVNMSLGAPSPYEPVLTALKRLKEEGVIVICAAGNSGHASGSGSTVSYPGRYCTQGACICIGAVDSNSHDASFSSTGARGDVTFVGPGVEVMSCLPGGKYGRMSGTSMATPAITGLVALLLAAKKISDDDDDKIIGIKDATKYLKQISQDLGAAGEDGIYGWGLPVWK